MLSDREKRILIARNNDFVAALQAEQDGAPMPESRFTLAAERQLSGYWAAFSSKAGRDNGKPRTGKPVGRPITSQSQRAVSRRAAAEQGATQ